MEARQGRRVEYCDLLYLYMDGKYLEYLKVFERLDLASLS